MEFKNLIEKLESVDLKLDLNPKWEESYSKDKILCRILNNCYTITPKVKDGSICIELTINYSPREVTFSTIEEAKLAVEESIKISALNLFQN